MPSFSAVADTIPFGTDTVRLNYFDIDIQTRYSTSSVFNGNVLVSPIESRIVQERLTTIENEELNELLKTIRNQEEEIQELQAKLKKKK